MQPFKGSGRGHSLTAASNFLRAVSTVSPAWARSTCSGRSALARIRSSSHFGQLGTSHFLKGSAGVPPAVSRILRDTSSSGWSILLQAVVGASRSKPAEPRMGTQRMTRLIPNINSAPIGNGFPLHRSWNILFKSALGTFCSKFCEVRLNKGPENHLKFSGPKDSLLLQNHMQWVGLVLIHSAGAAIDCRPDESSKDEVAGHGRTTAT